MNRITSIALAFWLLTTLIACDNSTVFEENLRIKNATWERNQKAFFEFEINDTTGIYDLYLNFRHGGDYPYQNIYLFSKSKSPSGKIAKDTAQMILANNKGRWVGKGIGDIFDYQFRFKQGPLFPEKGEYSFEIEQAMREENLDNVTDIGVSVKRVNE